MRSEEVDNLFHDSLNNLYGGTGVSLALSQAEKDILKINNHRWSAAYNSLFQIGSDPPFFPFYMLPYHES